MSGSDRKYLIWGYYGFGNLGDELMLSQITERILKTDSRADIHVACFDPPRDLRIKPFPFFSMDGPFLFRVARQLYSLLRMVTASDVLVIGGGTLFIDKGKHSRALLTLALMALFGRLLRKNICTIGVGIDILAHPQSIRYLRWVLNASDYVCLRDDYSVTLARYAAGEDRIVRGADILFDATCVKKLAGDPGSRDAKRLIIVSLSDYYHTWQNGAKRAALRKQSEELVSVLLERYGERYTIVLAAFQKATGECDYELLVDLYASLKGRGKADAIRVEYVETEDQARDLFTAAAFTIGMRYHALVLSAMNRTPFLGIDMEMKIREFCIEFNMPFINIKEFLANGLGPAVVERLSALSVAENILERQISMADLNFRWLDRQ